jgi:prolyl-tRNA synthetase
MLQSKLFTKTLRDAPKDEEAVNAKLLIRGGFIHKTMAGVYAFLPLGLRVLKSIEEIVREEMNALGGEELSLTALQDKNTWEKTDRWSDRTVDVWFKTRLQNDAELGLAFTHEEPLTSIMKGFISSYRDLPVYAYQFQTKFRNELRSKSGLLRGREFLMKDLYSFSASEEEHAAFYEKAKKAYERVFERLGLGGDTVLTFASGGSFSNYSHEFQTLCDAGEDTVYVARGKNIAVNKEVFTDEVLRDLGLSRDDMEERRAAEVGNIFSLGTKFSDPFGLNYLDETGASRPVIMGSYGIGVSRLMGVIAEKFNDGKGLLWPEAVAPFQVHLLELPGATARDSYQDLLSRGVQVLYDEREASAGAKFADADLIGIPWRAVVSQKTGEKIEVKRRGSEEVKLMSVEELAALVGA